MRSSVVEVATYSVVQWQKAPLDRVKINGDALFIFLWYLKRKGAHTVYWYDKEARVIVLSVVCVQRQGPSWKHLPY